MFKMLFWYWWAVAAVLLVFEMLLPGVVFMFVAVGAAAAGLLVLLGPEVALEWQLAVFALGAVASAVMLRRPLRRLQNIDAPARTLNARGSSLLGRIVVLDTPILGGRGRVSLDDGSWTVVGPDMARGAKVRIVAVNGTELKIEPAP